MRSRFTNTSHVVDMIGRIHADMFFQDRYLLNEVHMKIKLVSSRNSFCLMSADEFKVENAIMFVRKVKLSPSVFQQNVACRSFDCYLYHINSTRYCANMLQTAAADAPLCN